jgi:hypothetical protein
MLIHSLNQADYLARIGLTRYRSELGGFDSASISARSERARIESDATLQSRNSATVRHVRQIELCPQHCNIIIIERERSRGLEIRDRRNE